MLTVLFGIQSQCLILVHADTPGTGQSVAHVEEVQGIGGEPYVVAASILQLNLRQADVKNADGTVTTKVVATPMVASGKELDSAVCGQGIAGVFTSSNSYDIMEIFNSAILPFAAFMGTPFWRWCLPQK